MAAAGDTDIKQKLLDGYTAGDRSYKNHLDGYNFLPYLTGETEEAPREEIFYFSDDGDLTALRYNKWKIVFMEQRAEGTLRIWQNLSHRCEFRRSSIYAWTLRNRRCHIEYLL
ncbi:arylsulfatase [Vibrio astriarenae]|nr:arylsulfatase [Vibrio sp. C7]